jgi:hypothetical protein
VRRATIATITIVVATSAVGVAARAASVDAQTTPRVYVAAGLDAGADSAVDWLYAGASIDAGYRIAGPWWVHGNAGTLGRVGYGTTNRLTVMRPREVGYDLRLGPEVRRCLSGSVCFYGGVDVGYRTGPSRGEDISGVMMVPRAGLDLGSGHLRFQPGLELLVSTVPHIEKEVPLPALGIGVTAAFAYVW